MSMINKLFIVRIVMDRKSGLNTRDVENYLLSDFNSGEYDKIIRECRQLANTSLFTLFNEIPGYTDLKNDDIKQDFRNTLASFTRCQGKGRLMAATITKIEDRQEPEGLRVYLNECGEEGYQYFRKGSWG